MINKNYILNFLEEIINIPDYTKPEPEKPNPYTDFLL